MCVGQEIRVKFGSVPKTFRKSEPILDLVSLIELANLLPALFFSLLAGVMGSRA
jgi:hypothetical protein